MIARMKTTAEFKKDEGREVLGGKLVLLMYGIDGRFARKL